ncbi:MAG: YdcF family protein [Rhodospirillales bacterium]|nr:YdcF family protein [Rhodospirillales bacterium]
MFFTASKLFWLLAQPGNLLVVLLGVGALLLWTRRQRIARFLVSAVALVLLIVATVPLGEWLILPLEERIGRPATLPESVDGIIVLGGALDFRITQSHGELAVEDSGERVIEGMRLARRYPSARIVFTGGAPSLAGSVPIDKSRWLSPLLRDFDVSLDHVIHEKRSRNTYENAFFSKELVAPEDGEIWLLVTSAFHMPRSVGCFRRVGWDVIPYPVDYLTSPGADWLPEDISLSDNLELLTVAVREWIGLIMYRVSGRTDALLPEPPGEVREQAGS